MSGSVWGLNPRLPADWQQEKGSIVGALQRLQRGARGAAARSPGLRKHLLCRESAQTDAENHYFLSYWRRGGYYFMNHTIQSK